MQAIHLRHLIIGLAMLAAAGLALALTPREKMADQGPKIDLERLIPKQFADWTIDTSITPIQVSPEVKAHLDTLYAQILTRTYINKTGERIMLSIAYGDDQTGTLRVHRPDVCYTAQGFYVTDVHKDQITFDKYSWPVMRVYAAQNNRSEPITYWMTIGDTIATSGTEQRLKQLRYGLSGEIPDGMIFRVSSIDNDRKRAYVLQDNFVQDLLQYLPENDRRRLIGKD